MLLLRDNPRIYCDGCGQLQVSFRREEIVMEGQNMIFNGCSPPETFIGALEITCECGDRKIVKWNYEYVDYHKESIILASRTQQLSEDWFNRAFYNNVQNSANRDYNQIFNTNCRT